jgi:hypothetical protein
MSAILEATQPQFQFNPASPAKQEYDWWGIYQYIGPNRSGKGMGMAIEEWKAWRRGIPVFANCTENPYTGEIDHILRFPHYDYDPNKIFPMALEGVCVRLDQAEQFIDATAPTKAVRNFGNFSYQAKKRLIRLDFDTVRPRNIYNRVRFNSDWNIYCKRYPHDWHQPLKAVLFDLRTDEKGDGTVQSRKVLLRNPIERGFGKLYNSLAYVRKEDS